MWTRLPTVNGTSPNAPRGPHKHLPASSEECIFKRESGNASSAAAPPLCHLLAMFKPIVETTLPVRPRITCKRMLGVANDRARKQCELVSWGREEVVNTQPQARRAFDQVAHFGGRTNRCKAGFACANGHAVRPSTTCEQSTPTQRPGPGRHVSALSSTVALLQTPRSRVCRCCGASPVAAYRCHAVCTVTRPCSSSWLGLARATATIARRTDTGRTSDGWRSGRSARAPWFMGAAARVAVALAAPSVSSMRAANCRLWSCRQQVLCAIQGPDATNKADPQIGQPALEHKLAEICLVLGMTGGQ